MNNEITIDFISMDDMVESECCDIDQVIKIIEKVLVDYKNGKIMLPDKISQIFDEQTQNRINCMPSTLQEENICGVKWVSVFPQNPYNFQVPNVSGIIILSEITKGFPIAVMDGSLITAIRTACMGAIGAKYLAKKDSKIYGTIGTGEQAKAHFIAIKHIFPKLNVCYVASRSEKSENDFVDLMSKKYPDVHYITCRGDYELASKNADIVVTAVSCQKPLLKANAVKNGTYYCHVGGWEDEYGVPLKASKIVCDDWNSLKHRGSPTIAKMYQEGLLKNEDIYANIADIIDGTLDGRVNSEEIIYFNSIGLSFVDISVAYNFYKKVKKCGKEKKMNLQNMEPIKGLLQS